VRQLTSAKRFTQQLRLRFQKQMIRQGVEERHEVHLRREVDPPHLPRLYFSESEHKVILQKSIPSQIRQLILYYH